MTGISAGLGRGALLAVALLLSSALACAEDPVDAVDAEAPPHGGDADWDDSDAVPPTGWAKVRDGQVLLDGIARPPLQAKGFRVLSTTYVADERTVLYLFWSSGDFGSGLRTSRVERAHAASFRLVSPVSVQWAEDDARVYYRGVAVGADPKTFVLLSHGFARDARAVYRDGKTVPLAAASVHVSRAYLWDAAHVVFWDFAPVPQADPATFRVVYEGLEGPVARDAKRVFFAKRPIPGADPASFRRIAGGYGRDAHGVYYASTPIAAAERLSFESLGAGYARDARQIYYHGRRVVGVDRGSFRVNGAVDYAPAVKMGADVAEDDEHVFYDGRPLPRAKWWELWK